MNDKLHLLYEEILTQIENFEPSQVEFDSLKAQFLDNYSTYMKMASNYGKELRLWLMENTRNDALDRKNAFSEVTRQDMIDFVAALRKTAWCQMHVEGNFYQKEAEKLFNLSIKKLKSKCYIKNTMFIGNEFLLYVIFQLKSRRGISKFKRSKSKKRQSSKPPLCMMMINEVSSLSTGKLGI